MSAIDTIRELANAGKLSAFDCLCLMNSIGFALDGMAYSEVQMQARSAVIEGAYALMLMDKKQKEEA